MRKVLTSLLVSAALCAVAIPSSFVNAQNSSRRANSDAVGEAAAQNARPDASPDEYFIAFRDGLTSNDIASVKSTGASVTGRFSEVRALAARINNARQLDALARNPRVEYIEQVPMRYATSLSDTELTPSTSNGLYGLLTTKATTVHGRFVTGAGINVGVADTSLDYLHSDISPNYRGGIDTVGTGDSDPINNDGETHGTHVAGTILGALNGSGVRGVAYSANLYHARVLGPNGGSTTDIMEGVRHLVEVRGCKVINLSLGGGLKSRTEENFYKDMRNKGALVVAASGNDGATRVSYPAAYAVNIAVGAVDKNNVIASFSNKGTALDVVAPGVGVLSSVPRGQGFESSVTSGATFTSFGLEFAGTTAGTTGTLVNCGQGQTGEFPAGVAGNIALIQRGTISFADKVTNAMNAGATAAIIYNNAAGDFTGTLGAAGRWIPAVSVSDTTGATLVGQAGSTGSSATVVNKASDWDHYDGTSMATPHTAGVIALIWSANQALSNTTIESYLFTTCTDLGAAGYDTTYGRGIINADAAVAKAGK